MSPRALPSRSRKKYTRPLVAIILLFLILVAALQFSDHTSLSWPRHAVHSVAGTFFTDSVSAANLRQKYNNAGLGQRVRILIVPGHEPKVGGTEFRGVKERDVVLSVARELKTLIASDPHFEVYEARTKDGWNLILAAYFETQKDNVRAFVAQQNTEMKQLQKDGKVTREDAVEHPTAASEAVYHLYAINTWANENGIDIVLHLHFNDYPRARISEAGKYNGVAIFVPYPYYSNSKASTEIAQHVFKRLTRWYPASNMPLEAEGVVYDHDLIAIGSNNTLDAASLLLEYAYIYEPHIIDSTIRPTAAKDLALQTYRGLEDFFLAKNNRRNTTPETAYLPIGFNPGALLGSDLSQRTPAEIASAQAYFMSLGLYPPAEKTYNQCPITGTFGPCTKAAFETLRTPGR